MAGAQTTLSLQDKLTGPLMKIMKAMDSTIKVMEQMDNSTQQLDQKSLANARKNISNASADLERMSRSLNSAGQAAGTAGDKQESFNQRIRDGTSKMAGYATAILSAVGAYKLFNAGKNFLQNIIGKGVDFHAFKQASEVAFTTFLGDAQTAKQYMDDMYAFALKTPFAYPDLLEASRNMMAFGVAADNTFPIMQAIGDTVAAIGGGNAEMMNLADVFGQIQAQGKLTMMEVNRLSGYGVNAIEMLAEASGTTGDAIRKQISAGAIDAGTAMSALVAGMDKKFGGLMEGVKGTWRGAVDSMNSAMRNAGVAMTEALMKPEGPLVNLVTNVTGLIKKIPQYIGPAVAAFIPLIDMLNNSLAGNKFDHIFSMIGGSLTFMANMLSWTGQLALWVVGVFSDNWSWIEPIIMAAGAALSAYLGLLITYRGVMIAVAAAQALKAFWLGIMAAATTLATGATFAQTVAQYGLNTAMLAFPGTWILLAFVAVIALVIYAMVNWGEQTATVVGAVVGSIYWLGAAFYNVLMGIGNFGIMVAEWFVNTWNQAVFMVQLAWIAFNLMVRMVFDAIGNAALRTAEFFMNAWNNGVYAVQLAFHKMGEGVLAIMSGVGSGVVGVVNSALSALSTLINGAVSGINKLIGLINNIPGVNVGTVGNVDLKASTAAVDKINSMKASLAAPTKPGKVSLGSFNTAGNYASTISMPSAPQKASFGRLEYQNLGDAFSKGQQIGSNASLAASDKLTGAIDKVTGFISGPNASGMMTPGEVPAGGYDPTLGGASPGGKSAPGAAGGKGKGNNPTGGKLDKIGKIENEINIADEDLKLLLDAADSRSIQDISITLSPTVVFKDNLMKEEADVNKIVSKINKLFEDEMTRSVEGVMT